MKRLKTKVFITIFLILTISILIILCVFNSADYLKEKNNIQKNLNNMIVERNINKESPPDVEESPEEHPEIKEGREDNPRFMDVDIYTITIEDNKIGEIISHTKDETTPNEITTKASEILGKSSSNKTHIGNLYFEKYSYKYEANNKIIMIDNSETNKSLQTTLIISILVFLLFEGIAYIVSNSISKWIIKPVEASFNKQKQFIADASHELKTPLSVILASAEALENDKSEKWLQNIQSEANRMSGLIKNLLDLAKLENKETPKICENNNISKALEMAILPFESLIYEKDIKLDYQIEENLYLKCNIEEIKQLVAILIDNAIKHSKENGKIIVLGKKIKEGIKLEVKNQGEPIPKGEEEKIFERFYRVDKARNRKENRYGLGLAIAKSITEKYNGKIRAYSLDGYTIFEIIFKK